MGFRPKIVIYLGVRLGEDIHIYVVHSRLNGWTDWAEIVCGHSWVIKNVIG